MCVYRYVYLCTYLSIMCVYIYIVFVGSHTKSFIKRKVYITKL